MHSMTQLASMNEDQEVCSETLRVLYCAHYSITDACDTFDDVQYCLHRMPFAWLLVKPSFGLSYIHASKMNVMSIVSKLHAPFIG